MDPKDTLNTSSDSSPISNNRGQIPNLSTVLLFNKFQRVGRCVMSTSGATERTQVLHMCFDRFLLAFESRDFRILSQADKRITIVSSFPSFKFWMINYSYTQKSYLALWQNCFGQFITQKFPSLKIKQFSQFFLVRGKY